MTNYTRIQVNVVTGEQTIIELTPEEIAELENRQASPPLVPQNISRRQFFQQAAIAGFITKNEALAAIRTGTIPTNLQTVVDGISDVDQKFAAEMLLSGAESFQRNHLLVATVAMNLGLTDEQVDQFFISAYDL